MSSNIGFMTDYYFNMLEQAEIEHGIFEATVQGAFLENISLNESSDIIMVNEGIKDVMHKIWEGIVKIWHNFLGLLRKIRDFFLKGKLSKKANDLNKRCTNLINTIIKTGKEDTKISKANETNSITKIVIPPASIAISAADFAADKTGKTPKGATICLIFNSKLLATLSSVLKNTAKGVSYSQFKMALAPVLTIERAMFSYLKKKEYISRDSTKIDTDLYDENDVNIILDIGEKILSDCTVNDLSNYVNFDNLVSDTDTKISKLNSEEFTKVIAKVYGLVIPSITKINRATCGMLKDAFSVEELLCDHMGMYNDKEELGDLSSGNVVDKFMDIYVSNDVHLGSDANLVYFDLAIDVVKEIQKNVVSVGKNNKQLDGYISNMEKSISNMEDAFKSIMNNSNTAPEVASILKMLYDASMLDVYKTLTTEMFRSGLRLSGDLLDYYNKLISYVEKLMGITG